MLSSVTLKDRKGVRNNNKAGSGNFKWFGILRKKSSLLGEVRLARFAVCIDPFF
jgi:hypothetical protein